jgi:uncharacterized protein (TIGR03032 family)
VTLRQPQPTPPGSITTSGRFEQWLSAHHTGLAITTGAAGKLLTLGVDAHGRLSVCQSSLDRPGALFGDGPLMWVSSLSRLWRFTYSSAPGHLADDGQQVFCPRAIYTTGELDIHDIAVSGEGRAIFASTRFNCLATLDDRHSFRPLWRPPFISKLVPENRCHLSGLALRDGEPAFVTTGAQSDIAGGFRDHRRDGGCVIDVASGQAVASGLSMPHSPRWYRDRLWVLESGAGRFGWIDEGRGTFEPVAFCPGYLRGLSFAGDYAVMGLSRPEHPDALHDLPLETALRQKDAEPRCGVHIIDVRTGEVAHWIRLQEPIHEVTGVALLAGICRPLVLTLP